MTIVASAAQALRAWTAVLLLAGILGVAAGAGTAPAHAQARAPYTFLGMPWGIGIDDARARLERAGFRAARLAEGAQEEFIVQGLHAAIGAIDRGKRLVVRGRLAGVPVQVDLAFGNNDRLGHIIVTSAYWDGTIPGAKTLVDLSTRLVMLNEERYGPARKRKEDGWVDTAIWPRGADGSLLAVYVRGVEGFMFSPSYKTALRMDVVAGTTAASSKVDVGTEPPGPPPRPRPLTKEELRKEYQKDPSAAPPPPAR